MSTLHFLLAFTTHKIQRCIVIHHVFEICIFPSAVLQVISSKVFLSVVLDVFQLV